MKARPMMFSGPMVRAILDGTKTQTRRVVKPPHSWITPYADGDAVKGFELFHAEVTGGFWIAADLNGNTGDHWQCGDERLTPNYLRGDRLWVKETFATGYGATWFRASEGDTCKIISGAKVTWKPSIFMPRNLSRITLEITAVRIERLQAISGTDSRAEGVQGHDNHVDSNAIGRYRELWQSINGPGSWDQNPWVWVIEFKRL